MTEYGWRRWITSASCINSKPLRLTFFVYRPARRLLPSQSWKL